jgi:hypothetical protein
MSRLAAVLILVTALAVLAPATAEAAACNFTGSSGADWSSGGNWDCGHRPILGDDVTIDGSDNVTISGTEAATSLVQSSGTITFSGGGALAVNTIATVSGGAVTGAGTLTITGNLTKQSASQWTIRSGPTVNVNGGASHTDGTICIDDANGNTGDPQVNVNSTWTISGAATLACTGSLEAAGFHVVAPNGQLLVSDDTTISTPIDNDDTVTVAAGTLTYQSGLAATGHSGAWQVANGAALYFNGSAADLTGGAVTATGTLPHTGILETDASLTVESGADLDIEDIRQFGGTLTTSGASPALTPTAYTQTGGTRAGVRPWTLQTAHVSGGQWQDAATTTISGTLTKDSASQWTIRSGPTVNVNGGASHTDGTICIDDANGNTGDPQVNVNSTWTISGAATLACTGSLEAAAFIINASGSLVASNTGTHSIGTPVKNAAGAITVANNQQFNFDGGLTQTGGTTTVAAGGTLNGSVALQGGTFKGGGSAGGPITNSAGTLAPGASPGKLTVSGNYTQGAGGTLQVEIDGASQDTQYDHLDIGGQASLDGTLAIVFTPPAAINQGFDIVTAAGTVSGTFATVTGGAVAGGTYTPQYAGGPPGKVTLSLTGAPLNNVAPSIANSAHPGDTLTCDTGDWTGSPTFSFEWLSDGNPIGGQTTNQYTVAAGDVGHALRCRVTAHNGGGDTPALSNTVTPTVAAPVNNGATPSIPAIAKPGDVLTCDPGGWSGSPTFTFEWLSGGTPIASGSQYTVTAGDVGNAIRCRVTAHNAGGDVVALSNTVTPVPLPPGNTTAPSLPSSATQGDKLTCDPGAWSGSPTFTFEWLRDGVPIAGETTSSYAVTAADVGKQIACRVTATNGGGSSTQGSSAVVPKAPASPPRPSPTNTDQQTVRGTEAFSEGTSNDVLLACTTLDVILIDVLPASGGKVSVTGTADVKLAGKTADILRDGAKVGAAKIQPNGFFAARVAAPPKKKLRTARYQAKVGTDASQKLLLQRRMLALTLTRSGSNLVFKGRITPPFAKKPAVIEIERFLSCSKSEKVQIARVVPDRRGNFTVKFAVPGDVNAAIYRALTKVARAKGGAPRAPTFTLPRAIDIT